MENKNLEKVLEVLGEKIKDLETTVAVKQLFIKDLERKNEELEERLKLEHNAKLVSVSEANTNE